MNEPVTLSVKFRTRAQFYEIVRWLNTNIGQGTDNWTINGKVLRYVKKNQPVVRTVVINNPTLDIGKDTELYFNLL